MSGSAGTRVLGIDPGLRVTGYACLEAVSRSVRPSPRRSSGRGVATMIEAGVIRLSGGRGRDRGGGGGGAAKSVSQRLAELDADLREVIERTRPSIVAVEKLYAHYKHPTTAIIMGHARGVVLLNIRRAGLELVELGATEVKKSLTGNGHAAKIQMQEGVRVQLGLNARPEPADVADAMAIALCALRRR
ncbi:MAG: crossover junction endodeoxyribonuclease RuvC [Phycisphaerales bacterium]|nr:crossover junction endodeoxyribonuclease RuvC [Phycisphaerales bacterium]